MITEGETSYPFYFATLPTTPPRKLPCTSAWDSIEFKWKHPSIGMDKEMVYHYDYSLRQRSSGMAKGTIKTSTQPF